MATAAFGESRSNAPAEEGVAFSGQVRSLQKRLAEVRAQRQALGAAGPGPVGMEVPPLPALGGLSRTGSPRRVRAAVPAGAETCLDSGGNLCESSTRSSSLGHGLPQGSCEDKNQDASLRPISHNDHKPSNASFVACGDVDSWNRGCPGTGTLGVPRLDLGSPRRAPGAETGHRVGRATLAGVSLETDGPLYGSPEEKAARPAAAAAEEGSDLLRSDMDLLRSENNLLTEQLVEASLESAQHLEALSSNRDELRRLVQELRVQLDAERAERSACEAQLLASQEALDRLLQENARLGGTCAEATSKFQPAAETERSSQWQELLTLREKAKQHEEEVAQLRSLAEQRTSQANSTIMELAQRNLSLEARLQSAQRQLERVLPRSAHSGSTTPRATPRTARSSDRQAPGEPQRAASAQSLRSTSMERRPARAQQNGLIKDGRSLVSGRRSQPSPAGPSSGSDRGSRERRGSFSRPRSPPAVVSSRPRPDELQSSLDRLAEEMRRLQQQVILYNSD